MRFLLIAVLALIVVACYVLPDESFWQALCVSIAAGIGLFLIIPTLLLLVAKHEKKVVPPTLFIAAVSGGLAYRATNVTRDLLLELAIGLVLAVALDFYLHHALNETSKATEEALAQVRDYAAKIEAARKQIAAADAEFDYKYAMEDLLNIPRPYIFGGPGPQEDDE